MQTAAQTENEKEPLLFRIMKRVIVAFSPKYTLHGTENLPEEPCVIVGNHSQMFGPIAGELYIPVKHDVWCAGEMMHWKEVPAYAYKDFWSGKPKSVRWMFKIASYLITPLCVLVFNSAHTVPVYHDTRLISTFRRSIERLQEGSSMVIFPECYDEHNNIVHAFQDKFIDLARFYYKKTGTALQFVPLYIAPRLSTLYFGTPIRFDPEADIRLERSRICNALMDDITRMAVSLPEHTVVPYPNIPKRDYPKNIPLEVYSHEEKTG